MPTTTTTTTDLMSDNIISITETKSYPDGSKEMVSVIIVEGGEKPRQEEINPKHPESKEYTEEDFLNWL